MKYLGIAALLVALISPAYAEEDCSKHVFKREPAFSLYEKLGNKYEVIEGDKAERLLEILAIMDVEDKHMNAGYGGSVVVAKIKDKDMITMASYDKNQFICWTTQFTVDEATQILEEAESRLE